MPYLRAIIPELPGRTGQYTRYIGQAHVPAIPGATVTQSSVPLEETSADHDGPRNADQFGVGEFHPGRQLGPVVDQHPQSRVGQIRRGGQGGLDLAVPAGGDDVHVGGCDLVRPQQAAVVVVLLGDGRDRAGETDTVAAHGGPDRLTVRAQHIDLEGVGVPPAELEDVRDLDAPADGELADAALRTRVSGADLGRLDGAVRSEVAPGDHRAGMPARFVRAGQPGGAGDDARVGEVTDCDSLRADVALDQVGPGLEVVEHGGGGRRQRGVQPFQVHLPVPRYADHQEFVLLAGAVD